MNAATIGGMGIIKITDDVNWNLAPNALDTVATVEMWFPVSVPGLLESVYLSAGLNLLFKLNLTPSAILCSIRQKANQLTQEKRNADFTDKVCSQKERDTVLQQIPLWIKLLAYYSRPVG